MGSFTVQFTEAIQAGPSYDDYQVNVSTPCNDDAQQRNVKFNDIITGDFVVGFNYNSSGGYSAQSIQILSYTDEMISTEISTSVETVPPGFVPSELKRISTNTALNYPYTMNINNLNDIGLITNSFELICQDSSKYVASRTRRIEYIILDTNGQAGPTKTATFTNSQQ